MIGETVAHYQVLEKLGQGGMGVVYKARDVRLSRLVALKILRDDRTISHERQRRFLAEAQTASALNHPHIATIYDVQHNGDDIDFIAMEYIQGHSLDRLIGRGGLPVAEALRYAVAIADALAAAHAAGIVHRDLKPSNVMVSETGHGQGAGFRACEADTHVSSAARSVHTDATASGNRRRRDRWDRRIHEPGTGGRKGARCPVRYFQLWCRSL